MTPAQFTSRIEAFALRDGLTFASLIGLSPADRVIVVATMAALFDPNGVYAEREVNERLQWWLDGTGAHVETDRVTLRRWLVDTRVLSRNDDCTDYRLAIAGGDPLVGVARELDCWAIAKCARDSRDTERARRKDAWMQRSGLGEATR